MKYKSTRGAYSGLLSAEVIKMGISPDGGLFVPDSIPKLTLQAIEEMKTLSYQEIAKIILGKYLTDFTEKELEDCISLAYNSFNFDNPDIAPVVKLSESIYILELWHGPTAAFKDMALQIMPHLLSKAIKKVGKTHKDVVILVATSGDTGKAALEGYKDIEGIKIIVFYPNEGVSRVQELQMVTTTGDNTFVAAVNGNFDDCQTGVKNIFTDREMEAAVNELGYEFSSANSINWGRLVPQIVYYFKAYLELVKKMEIPAGERVNFCVPTGNFGNILAGYYAKQMGLPINKLICASNINNVLTDFINTGVYDKQRDFFKTTSPSMDIIISSNLERFLFELSGHDSEKIKGLYSELNENGKFTVDKNLLSAIKEIVVSGYTDETETSLEIRNTYEETGYLLDTHTAVAMKVAKDDILAGKTIIDSTASPYKFSNSVINAISGKAYEDEFDSVNEINKTTGIKLHKAVIGLKDREIRFKDVINTSEMKNYVINLLKK